MKTKTINLGEGSIAKIFFHYVIPSIIGMLAMTTAGIIDGIFVGRYVGSEGLAAINLVMPLVNLYAGIGIMIGTGGATLANIKRGNNKIVEANNLFTVTIIILVVISVLGTLITLGFTKPLVFLLGANEAISGMMSNYLFILSIFFIFFIMAFTLDMFIRNDGKPVFSVVVLVCGSIINIILDYVFVAKLGWGLKGAALATGISQALPVAILFGYIVLKSGWKFQKPVFDFKSIKNMFYNGSSEMVNEISAGITAYIFNLVIMSRIGVYGVAAFTIAQYANMIAVALFFAIAEAIHAGVSFNTGAKKFDRVIKFRKIAMRASIVLSILMWGLFFFFGQDVVSVFAKENSELINLSYNILICINYAFIFMGINIIASMYFTAINCPKQSILIAISRSLIGLILGIAILPSIFGNTGIWLSILFAETLTLLPVVLMLKKREKEMFRVNLQENLLKAAPNLHKVAKNDLNRVAKVMVEAFNEDPLWAGLFSTEQPKGTIMEVIFRAVLQYYYEKGILVATSPEFEGVMVWTQGSPKSEIREGLSGIHFILKLLKLIKYLPIRYLMKLFKTLSQFEMIREKRVRDMDYCYLEIIFVQKHFRGKKHGSKLLTTLLSYCDTQNLICFVDTNNPANLSIYERYGFILRDVCRMGNATTFDYFMERKPTVPSGISLMTSVDGISET